MQAARKHSVFFPAKKIPTKKVCCYLQLFLYSCKLFSLSEYLRPDGLYLISNPRFFTLPQTWINNLKKIIKKELIWTNIKLLIKLNLFLILDLIIKIQVFSSFHNFFFLQNKILNITKILPAVVYIE